MTEFTTITIGRTHQNPRVEIYLDCEIIGFIDVEPRGNYQARLRIKAAPALRFVRAELSESKKAALIKLPFREHRRDVPRGTSPERRTRSKR